MEQPHPDFEVFEDAAYFDMFCVRPKGSKDFNATLHFADWKTAVHASHTVAHWMGK